MTAAVAQKRSRGGQTIYSQKIADEICDRLAAGESLNSICKSPHLPAAPTVLLWVINDDPNRSGFIEQYARAREAGYLMLAEQLLEISDADVTHDGRPDPALVQRARLMCDSRKWLLSKMMPKRFGDKVVQEVTGADGAPLIEGPSDPSKVALVLLNILNRAREGDEAAEPVMIEQQDEAPALPVRGHASEK